MKNFRIISTRELVKGRFTDTFVLLTSSTYYKIQGITYYGDICPVNYWKKSLKRFLEGIMDNLLTPQQYHAEKHSTNSGQESIKSSWLSEEHIPEHPCPRKTWRYYIMSKEGRELAVYKDITEALKFAPMYKDCWLYSYAPTIEELVHTERIRRTERTFQSGVI